MKCSNSTCDLVNVFGLSMEEGEVFVNSLRLAEICQVAHWEVSQAIRRQVEKLASLLNKEDMLSDVGILREEKYTDSMNREQKVLVVSEELAYHTVFSFESEEAIRIQAILVSAIKAYRKLYTSSLLNESKKYSEQVASLYADKTEYQKRYFSKALETDDSLIFRKYETIVRIARSLKTPRQDAASENVARSALGCRRMATLYKQATYSVYTLLMLKEEGTARSGWPSSWPEERRANVEKYVTQKEFNRLLDTAVEWNNILVAMIKARPQDARPMMLKHCEALKKQRQSIREERAFFLPKPAL